jgi:hypothetical protein
MNRFERTPTFNEPEGGGDASQPKAESTEEKSRFSQLGEELENFKIETPEDADKALDMLNALSEAALQEMDDVRHQADVKARGKILELDMDAMKRIKEQQIDVFGSVKKWLVGKPEKAMVPDPDIENAVGKFLNAKNVDELVGHFENHPQREKLSQNLAIRSLVATHLGLLLVQEDDPEKAIALAKAFSINSWPADVVTFRVRSNIESTASRLKAIGKEDAGKDLKRAFGQEGKRKY